MSKTKVERVSFWEIAGPFDNPVKDGKRIGLDMVYPPEGCPVDPSAKYVGKDGEEVAWKELSAQPSGFYELFFTVPDKHAVAYCLTYLYAGKPGIAELKFSSYAGLKVFVNGEVVGVIPPPERPYEPGASFTAFQANLKVGRNELLVKCEHDESWWGFFFRPATVRPRLHEYFLREARDHARRFERPPRTLSELRRWQVKVRKDLVRLMGFPKQAVKPVVKEAEKVDCGSYVKHRLYIKTEKNWEVPALLLMPKSARPDRSSRAMLCLHGHSHGMADLALDLDFPDMAEWSIRTNHDYARRFAEEGYVAMTIDGRGAFGELGDMACSVAYAFANAIGRPLLGMRVWDSMKALDVLLARPQVDPSRVGCTGISGGGTHTAYLTMVDTRVKASLVSGYFSDFEDILYRMPVCPCQYLPGLMGKYDFQDLLFGLAAPRPLYIQNGVLDTLYTPARVRAAFRNGKQIYRKMNEPENAVLEMHDQGHLYRFESARDWFAKVFEGH